MKGNVILLNKLFLGGWLNKEGNIGHEIIDFIKTDNGECYVYNNPWGVCPDDIFVGSKAGKGGEQYKGEYLVLTSEGKGKKSKDFYILYVIKLAEKIHTQHAVKRECEKSENEFGKEIKKDKTKWSELRKRQEEVKKLMEDRNIKYNDKYLHEIYGEDDTLYLTFRGHEMYKAKNPILVTGLSYNFQRNKGYIYDDKFEKDYKTIEEKIKNSLKDGTLEKFTPKSVNEKEIGALKISKTFLDLIGEISREQVYTNILYSILEQGGLLKQFCEKFCNCKEFAANENFKISKETKIVDGRMDICAESKTQRIIIENKVYSGLNGIKPADAETQLTTYYNWGKEEDRIEPLCFVTVPNFRKDDLEWEISNHDKKAKEKYEIITYSEIVEFIKNNRENIPQNYIYKDLLDQIIYAFNNLSYKTKEDFYAQMFLVATKNK